MKPQFEVGLWPQHTNGITQYTPFIRDANLKIVRVMPAGPEKLATIMAHEWAKQLRARGYAAEFIETRVVA